MPTLRKMIDEGQIAAASPLATHVSKHVTDPIGETKEGFEDLAQKQADYNVAKENMRRNLMPVQSVLDHVNQMHELEGMPPDPNMMQDPNNPDLEQGLPNNMQQKPGKMGPSAGKPGMAGPSQPGTGPRLQPNKPPVVPGSVPGQSARPQEAVRPGKMGMPQPGQARPAQVAGNPGAKKPGAAGKGKPQSKVEVKVHASRKKMPRRGSIDAGMEMVSLRAAASGLGDGEIRNKLQEALKDKYGTSNSSCNSCGPIGGGYIEDVFSSESYFVYSNDGKKYRHDFTIKKGEVTLVGEPKKVKIAYVEAGAQRKKV